MKNPVTIFWSVLGVLILGAVFFAFVWKPAPSTTDTTATNVPAGKYTAVAQCLADKGVKFYGAFWCPHCQRTKASFGDAAKLLPYIECSTPDQQGQTQICIDKKITGYPTWVYPGTTTVLTGEHSIAEIAGPANCPVPAN